MAHNQLKVLLVDDDINFLRIMKKALEDKGCIVQTTGNHAIALSTILNEIIHVAFIDCVLLFSEGISVARQIREAVGQSVEIVIMSGIVSRNSVESRLNRNNYSFLKKPLQSDDMNQIITKAKNKVIQGMNENILIQYFSKITSDQNKLKYLFSLNKVKDFEFFLTLSGLLELNKAFTVQFSPDGKYQHTAFIKDGAFVDYVTDARESILRTLLTEKILTETEARATSSSDIKQITDYLISKGRISPHQVTHIKTQLFFSGLKSLIGREVQVVVDFSEATEEWFCVTPNDFGDKVFSFLKEYSFSQFQDLIAENLMEASIQQIEERSYLFGVDSLKEELKKGLKISDIQSKKQFSSPEQFYARLFYIFLKGGISLTGFSSNIQYKHIQERYRAFNNFLKNNKPRTVFQLLDEVTIKEELLTEGQITKSYHRFMSSNHIDKLPPGLPKETVNHINSVSSQLKEYQNQLLKGDSQEESDKAYKNKQALEIVQMHKQQKLCQEFLERGDYEKGFQILSSMPEKAMKNEMKCKLLYLWIAFQKPSVGTDEDKKSKFFHDISVATSQSRKSCLYFYVLGLFYANQENDAKAMECFNHAKQYDLSFKPAHQTLKETALRMAQKKTKKRGIGSFIAEKRWQKAS